MSDSLRTEMERLIEQEQLPPKFYYLAARYYLPLADTIAESQRNAGRPWMVGVNGAQGTGKSTLGRFLQLFLERRHNLRCVTLSIDDFYYTHEERELLAKNTHPLLLTRGVPGTHDVSLGISTCQQLLAADGQATTPIPRFNKALDDRYAPESWPRHEGATDVLLFEGWCVGNRPQLPETLQTPINALEADEDRDGRWRQYVNNSLQHYQPWFRMIDQLVMLKAPSMAAIFRWRLEQEQKLAERHRGDNSRIMNSEQIIRFVQHYERLTTFALEEMPQRADCVFHLNEDHNIFEVSGPLADAIRINGESDSSAG